MDNASSFKGKADKLLGLDQNENHNKILLQKNGYLHKTNGSKQKSWKKFYCIVKDGFFLWYSQENKDMNIPFDTKPKGVLPLGGSLCAIDQKDRRIITCRHPDIPGAHFHVRAQEPGEAMDWMVALENAKKATWENALLGNALIEKMKNAGGDLEEEKQKAFDEMQQKAAKLAKEQEQKAALLRKDQERQKAFQERLKQEKEKSDELSAQRSTLEGHLKKEEDERKAAARKRMSVERKLAAAEAALKKLEAAMIVRTDGPSQFPREDEQVRASVSALRSFFEARANEQAVKAKALYERLV